MNNADLIRMSFPVNPAYVSSARLTVSSIANRINFDIDEIEDIKTAVSEACTYIIKRSTAYEYSDFEICFKPKKDEMVVEIVAGDSGDDHKTPAEEMSLMMIRALVDEFVISKPSNDKVLISMLKKHKDSNM